MTKSRLLRAGIETERNAVQSELDSVEMERRIDIRHVKEFRELMADVTPDLLALGYATTYDGHTEFKIETNHYFENERTTLILTLLKPKSYSDEYFRDLVVSMTKEHKHGPHFDEFSMDQKIEDAGRAIGVFVARYPNQDSDEIDRLEREEQERERRKAIWRGIRWSASTVFLIFLILHSVEACSK